MQRYGLTLLLVAFFSVPASLKAQPVPANDINEALQKELADRVKEQQEADDGLLGEEAGMAAALKKIDDVGKRNAAWLNEVFDKHGWPGKSLVGLKGENDAWVLIIHAERDRALQSRCVGLLKESVRKGETHGQYLALLTDRVRLAEGKKQLYGTNLIKKGGELVPSPIEDEANVDKRRKDIGLPSVAESIERLKKFRERIGPKKT